MLPKEQLGGNSMAAIGNIDTMYFQVSAENFYTVFASQLKELQGILEYRMKSREHKPIFLTLGKLEMEVTNGRYSWSYGLKCSDFHLFFIGQDSKAGNVMPMYVEFSQQYLWLYGYKKAYARFMDWLREDCGLKGLETKISRADLCVHTDAPILKEEYLENLHYDPRCEVGTITSIEFSAKDLENMNNWRFDTFKRAKEGYTGIRVGKGQPLMARIYNKSLEIKNSKKEWFKEIWRNAGLDAEHVNNIEYEIKREWYNERGIDSVEEFLDKIGDIWLYLTKNYLSFRHKDNTRRSRRSICAWWQEIREETFSYNGSVIARRQMLAINTEKAVEGILGYAVSYAAGTGRKQFDRKMFLELYRQSLAKEAHYLRENKPTFPERIKHKSNRGFANLADPDNLFLDEYKEISVKEYGHAAGAEEKIALRSW